MARRGIWPTPCAWPGCPAVVRTRYCDTHRRMASRQYEAGRPSSAERGYGWAWTKIREAYLAAHPDCSLCGAPATVVDHITPRAEGGSDDNSNLQSLCTSCHRRRTAPPMEPTVAARRAATSKIVEKPEIVRRAPPTRTRCQKKRVFVRCEKLEFGSRVRKDSLGCQQVDPEAYLENSVYVNELGDEGDERVRAAYGANYDCLDQKI